MTAMMIVRLPWVPVRSYFMKINSDVSVVGKKFTVTINGKSFSGRFGRLKPFWRRNPGAGLNFYAIDDDNSIAVDIIGDCPNIESIKLNIEGGNVPIKQKALSL